LLSFLDPLPSLCVTSCVYPYSCSKVPPAFPTRRSSDLQDHLVLDLDSKAAVAEPAEAHGSFLPEVVWISREGSQWTGSARSTAIDRKSTRLNSSHVKISYAVFCLKKKNNRKKRRLNELN